MVLINCPECQKQISEQANICPNCGYVLAKSNKLHIAAIILFILSAIALSVTIIQLWWGTWATFAIYLGIALLLAVIGVFIQIYPTLREKRKIKSLAKQKTESLEAAGSDSINVEEETRTTSNLYDDIATTPLKWHKFFSWFLLPVTVLYYINETTRPITIGSPIYFILIFIQAALGVVMIVGLTRFRRYSYIILFAYLIAIILFNVISIIFAFIPSFFIENAAIILFFLGFWIPTIIYYYKRKSLFVN